MSKKTLQISEDFIKEKRRIFLMMQIVSPLFLIGMYFLDPRFGQMPLSRALVVFVIATALIETILIIQPKILLKMMKQRKLMLNDDGITLSVNNNSNNVKFDEIKNAVVQRKSDDTVKRIKISAFGGGLDLFGFEDLNSVVSDIESKVSSEKIIKKKTSDLGSNPLALFGVMVLTALFIGALQKYGGRAIYEVSNAFFMSVVGFIILFTKPISKNGVNQFLKIEVICGSVMMVCGIILLVLELL